MPTLSKLRPLALTIALVPGVLLPLGGHWVAFFIWLGAATVLGWAIAAAFSALRRDAGVGNPPDGKLDRS